jgi:hypothetical protein
MPRKRPVTDCGQGQASAAAAPGAVMKDFDEIIRERIAGLPPEQITEDVLRNIIIEVLMTQPDVPLTGMARFFVALQLERLLPKKEQAERGRQRLLRSIEDRLVTAKWARKNLWPKRGPKGEPQPTAIKAVHEFIFRNPDDLRSRFRTIEALEQFLKRERDAKQKPQR